MQAALLDDGDWFLELWSAQVRLLARGSAPADEVAALAPALTAKADVWEPPSSLESSRRRFTDIAQAVRAASDQARVRAATTSSLSRAPSPSAPQPVPAGAIAAADLAATRRSR
ncbi:hypothetical protein ABZW30_23190 [Kitasatospora sp. NPDC004669]|uniref:hypothetical protein n=1 Tax=Kitasatospora sp. NPDC004669 TaxID=3154555 RepID=UPI0033A8E0BF